MTDTSREEVTLVATPSQTVGPFFDFALTPDMSHGTLCHESARQRIALVISVTDGEAQPVTDAVVEIWQSAGGTADPSAPSVAAFGRLGTDETGSCEFDTVRPDVWPGAAGPRAAHINVCLFARGLLRQLHTRIYFGGDPALDQDPVLALVPNERRATLVAVPDATGQRWLFQVRLQGQQETVFFDV